MNHIQIIGTGLEFIKCGIRGTESVLEELVLGAEHEIQVMAFVFTSKANKILQLLERKAGEGVSINIIVNNLNQQEKSVNEFLREMALKFSPYVTITDFYDGSSRQLHAKVIVVDRNRAILGSANLSWSGMVNNYELGVMIEGSAARKIATIVDRLIAPIDMDDNDYDDIM